MDNFEEYQRVEVVSSTIDLIDEDCFDEDDINDGVPVEETDSREGTVDQSVSVEDHCSISQAYGKHLREFIRLIKFEIERCQKKQNILSKRIEILENQPTNPAARKNWYHLFGFPYFKDKSFFPCPMNEDQRLKLYRHELDYCKLDPVRRWNASDCLKLERGIRSNAIEKKTTGYMVQRGAIMEEFVNLPNLPKEKTAELNEKLRKIEELMEAVKDMNTKVLVGDVNTEYDWMKIASLEFGDQRSSEEIEAMWKLCRHPSINRKHWTRSENEALSEIVKKYKKQNWAEIASALNTNRSEFQCVIQYQRKLNTDLLNSRWTEDEDKMLKYLVENSRIEDYIPWATISLCMKNRTRVQIYNRWTFSLNPAIKKGRFTEKEDCLILAGVKHFGEDFGRIAELLPGRNSVQISVRYKMVLSREGPRGRFTVDEDMQLLKLVEKHGKNWKVIASEHHIPRSRAQVRHRYKVLEEWLSKNPDATVSSAPRRDLGDYSKRNANIWMRIQRSLNAIKKTKKKDEGIDKEDMKLLQDIMAKCGSKMRFPRNCGRKKKAASKADILLNRLLKPCYLLPSGRTKAIFTEGDIQKRQNIMHKFINILKARFAFPFDESVIIDDPVWNEADERILLALKKKYDEENFKKEEEGTSIQVDASEKAKEQAGSSQSIVPFYRLENNISSTLPDNFPAFIRNVIGLRTVLLSRENLKMWQGKRGNKNEVISLPAFRPASQALQDEGKGCFSMEESAKLFSERMFSIFYWPVLLARVAPEFDNTELMQPGSETFQADQPPAKKSKKRGLKDSNRTKRILMRERWKKFREQQEKKKTGHSSFRSAARAKRELSMN
ncbi:snRNA-activating protein complex subunit 4-like [Ischnura elegans]|uniref:snRNA-activating protein complex subunit 4-like n=1 Tax=Ischnura elegans TaxID=197161 RepID=UPI001ED86EA5|nr:snRNA-activating protein complex subunit 4-like [Ischnura elegans]